MNQLTSIAIYAIPVIIAITLHEAAHGYVARLFGDDTAAKAGRVTLNPLKHIDLFGTILLPAFLLLSKSGFLFGWAKPVPVNFSALRHPKRDMIWVAAAGPAMNILLAMISALAWRGCWPPEDPAAMVAGLAVEFGRNQSCPGGVEPLAHPAAGRQQDRGGIAAADVALPLWRMSRFGMIFLLVIFFVAPLAGLDVFGWMIGRPVALLERGVLALLHQPAP